MRARMWVYACPPFEGDYEVEDDSMKGSWVSSIRTPMDLGIAPLPCCTRQDTAARLSL